MQRDESFYRACDHLRDSLTKLAKSAGDGARSAGLLKLELPNGEDEYTSLCASVDEASRMLAKTQEELEKFFY